MSKRSPDTSVSRDLKAPQLDDIEAIAHEEFARLPAEFRNLCGDLVIHVHDFPSDDVLTRMNIDDDFGLLGLFEGVGLPFQSTNDVPRMPNMIWLYRRPILDYWAEHDETLGALVSHVLIHEIGHHFGLSDADMEAIEASVA
jgi:predicted Zn-dependent protease with MMP-like domain